MPLEMNRAAHVRVPSLARLSGGRSTSPFGRRKPTNVVRAGPTSDIKRDGLEDPRMSQIVIHNGVAYFSGQVGASSNTVKEQAIETLAKCDALLERAGTTKDRLLTCMVWLKDIKDAPEFNEVYNAWIDGENKPTRACVQAEMARPNLLVEVQITAAMPP